MKKNMKKYDPAKIEKKWQARWKKDAGFLTANDKGRREKKYILDMFPYPSGDGLHCGHAESYTATDIIARYWRMKGMNVLHPQGWDAFGLPAENYAVKTKIHPAETTRRAIANFKRQMAMLGLSYDWSREINSSEPAYYRWTQWFFLLLYKNGLAYKKTARVNWCQKCQTVLANEQAEGGICERCKSEVIQKDLAQWFFKITDFIESRDGIDGLIDGLDKIDWPESTKAAQKNWIGRSEGARFAMPIVGGDKNLEVFTTRLDTVFGLTFVLMAPEHRLIRELKARVANWRKVEEYLEQAARKTDLQRQAGIKDKTGVELKGVRVRNPFTGEEIPVFVSDFVLAYYGAGAVMAVPAHDERDFEFAKKFSLPIKRVIGDRGEENLELKEAYVKDGILINSGEYDGLTSAEARKKMTQWLEASNLGGRQVNYKMRDWLVSRQRYWGAPIPIIYCEKCGEMPVPEKDLPVRLPVDVDFVPHGESPLARSKKFQKVKCPFCGASARREADTMDTFVCSSWYYFRYVDSNNKKKFADGKMIDRWLPVDLYVGGAEHTVLHLLYARFFTKVLRRLGYLDFDEPFLKLRHQGIILAEDGRKMSKSLGNVVNPDEVIAQYGADALRLFEMFMGPLEDAKPWNTQGIVGMSRFLEKIWKLINEIAGEKTAKPRCLRQTHKIIKKVGEDIENLKFNTAIAALMEYVNYLRRTSEEKNTVNRSVAETLLKLIAPFAPHLAEELWFILGHGKSIFREKWPVYDANLAADEFIELPAQINGKTRAVLSAPAGIAENEAVELAKADAIISKWLAEKTLRKIIFVKGRLINFVI